MNISELNEKDLTYNIKEKIRTTNLHDIKIGGDCSFSFMRENDNKAKPIFAHEFLYSAENIEQKLQNENSADIISIKFDIKEEEIDVKIEEVKNFLKNKLLKLVKKPLILRCANNSETDKKLLPVLAEYAPCECIIAFGEEQSYEDILPYIIKNNHIFVLRTPIDINLAKELNILTTDKGLSPEKILIDPDMGGLGYGLDYGYSIIERIRQAAFEGDTMLNMPVIAFIGEESYRAKEAKSDTFNDNWGKFEERSVMWEIAGATSMISAGADIVVLWNEKSIEVLKGMM